MTTGEELNEALIQIKMIAQMALGIDREIASGILSELGRMHAAMPIVDPTGYRRDMGRIDESRDLVRAFLTFRDVAQRIVDRELGKGTGKDAL